MRKIVKWIALFLIAGISTILTLNVENFAEKYGLDRLYNKWDVVLACLNDLVGSNWFWAIFFILAVGTIFAWAYGFRKKKDTRIPFLEFLNEAEKHGWVFKDDSHHILDICFGVREAALAEKFMLWGRRAHSIDSITRNEPLDEIPSRHWSTYKFDPCYCLNLGSKGAILSIKEDNFCAYTEDRYHTHGYADVYIEKDSSLTWLKNEAVEYMGRNSSTPSKHEEIILSEPMITVFSGATNPCYQYGQEGHYHVKKCRVEIRNDRFETLHNVAVRLEDMETYLNNCLPERLKPLNGNNTNCDININPGMKEYFDVAHLFENENDKKLILCYCNKDKPNIIPYDDEYTLHISISGDEFKSPIFTRFSLKINDYGDLSLEQLHCP